MSHKSNDEWSEHAYADFRDVVEMGDWLTAEIVIRDAREVGLSNLADSMQKELTHERFNER